MGTPYGLCPTCLLAAGSDTLSANLGFLPGEERSPTGQSAAPIQDFGDYELLRELGRGGMGVVYLARQRSLKRWVAVKMLLAGPLASESFVRRFRGEAEAAARIRHPHIVAIHEVGERDGLNYFSMDYIEGRNLAEHLRGRTLSGREAARLLRTLANAVSYAHARDVIHRDLKPSNVLIDAAGEPHITDFGLARCPDWGNDWTASGPVVGTPSYMSPEQAAGSAESAGPTSDIYSLGAILYETLCGRPPFRAATVLETLRQVVETDPIPPRVFSPQVPADLETICLKCLAKEPARRYGSADELEADLGRFLREEPVHARPLNAFQRVGRWARRRPAVAGLTAALFLLLAVGVAGLLHALTRISGANRIAEQRRTQAETARRDSQERLALSYVANGMRVLDTGDWLGALHWLAEAFAVDPPDPHREQMHRLRLGWVLERAPRLTQILGHEGEVHHVEFSPDGRLLLTSCYDRAARLWKVDSGELAAPPLMHEGQINFAFFSPDGRLVLTASDDHTARVWDARTGEPVTAPLRHADRVLHASFSPDGQRLVSASADHTARVWDSSTGNPLTPPLSHRGSVGRAEFSPDRRWVLTASSDGTARLWEAATGLPAGAPLEHADEVTHVCFSPSGSQLATVCADGTVRIWDRATAQPASVPMRHESRVAYACFSPEGDRLATAAMDGFARIWEVRTGRMISPPLSHGSGCLHVRFSADGRRVVTASNDQSARVWDAETGEPVTPPLKHTGWVRQSTFSADGTLVASASGDFTAKIWALPTEPAGSLRLPHPGPVTRATFSHDGERLASAVRGTNGGGAILLWNAATGQPLAPPILQSKPVNGIAFNPGDDLLLTAGEDGRALVWDVRSGELAPPILEHPYPVRLARFSDDGRRVLTLSHTPGRAAEVRVWAMRSGAPIMPPILCPHPVWNAAFSPDGSRVVTASGRPYGEGDEGEAQVWDATTGRPIGPPLRHTRQVRDAAFSPDGRRVVTASSDQTVCVWDAVSGARLAGPIRHGGWVAAVQFARDGQRLVSICDDQTARVWNAVTGEALSAPMKHAHFLYRGVFSPECDLVATASADGTARVWDATSGQPLTPALRHRDDVGDVAFSPDGRRVLTASADHTLRVWPLTVSRLSISDLRLVAQLLSARRLDPAGGSIPLEPRSLAEALRQLRRAHPDLFSRVQPEPTAAATH